MVYDQSLLHYILEIKDLPKKADSVIQFLAKEYGEDIQLGEIISILLMAAAKVTGCDFRESEKNQFVDYYLNLSKSYQLYYNKKKNETKG